MQIKVETRRCVGAGQCVLCALGTFDQDDDGIVVLLRPEPVDAAETARVVAAADRCPVGAITLEIERNDAVDPRVLE
jgi:ferredoxin